MYAVYWTEYQTDVKSGVAQSRVFDSTVPIAEVLSFTESLRKARREGARYALISMQSENIDCVGEQGVSDKLPEGYDWSKQHRAGKMRRR